MTEPWIDKIEKDLEAFSKKHKSTYNLSKKNLAASFEVGCFHALINFYENSGFTVSVQNLTSNGEYRYLTTPAGNPNNFSYVLINGGDGIYEIRQQVRIRSHIDENIAFSPDIVVIKKDATIHAVKDADYAKGKKNFYSVNSIDILAAHECKSMPPFPELMVSFVGMLVTAHYWYNSSEPHKYINKVSKHLAPTMFVGGSASGLHLKMIAAMQSNFPINLIVGMHYGTWNLYTTGSEINRLNARKLYSVAKSRKTAA